MIVTQVLTWCFQHENVMTNYYHIKKVFCCTRPVINSKTCN